MKLYLLAAVFFCLQVLPKKTEAVPLIVENNEEDANNHSDEPGTEDDSDVDHNVGDGGSIIDRIEDILDRFDNSLDKLDGDYSDDDNNDEDGNEDDDNDGNEDDDNDDNKDNVEDEDNNDGDNDGDQTDDDDDKEDDGSGGSGDNYYTD